MKTHAIILSSLAVAAAAFGQASFELANLHSPVVNAPVFDANGGLLEGSSYLAELWGSSDSNSLTPLVLIYGGERREIVPFRTDGYFFSPQSDLSVTTVPSYGWAWLQVRAWDARLGATYEEAASHGLGGYGESPLFYARGNNPLAVPPEIPASLIGLQSFSLRAVVPEPSTWALLVLGGIRLGWTLRRKSKQT